MPQDENADPNAEPALEEVAIDDDHAQPYLDPEPEPRAEIDPVEPDEPPIPDPLPDA